MEVLIYEPKFFGHFIGFAAQTANAFAALNVPTTLALARKAKGSPQARIKLAQLLPSVKVTYPFDLEVAYSKKINPQIETQALAQVLSRKEYSHVVIPSADFVLQGLLWNMSLRRELSNIGADLILHNIQQAYPFSTQGRIQNLIDRLSVSIASRMCLYSVDPYINKNVSRLPTALRGNPILPLPHFHVPWQNYPSKNESRTALGFSPAAKIIGSSANSTAGKESTY